MKRLVLPIVAGLLIACCAADASAGDRRRGLLRRAFAPQPHSLRTHHPRYVQPYRYDRYEYYRQLYPQYYGGFHARYFQSIGVPPGDIGPRGNGIFMTPW